jgi:hypothetical protein
MECAVGAQKKTHAFGIDTLFDSKQLSQVDGRKTEKDSGSHPQPFVFQLQQKGRIQGIVRIISFIPLPFDVIKQID